MALKPFYNKKGHLGMTRQQLLEKLNGGGGKLDYELVILTNEGFDKTFAEINEWLTNHERVYCVWGARIASLISRLDENNIDFDFDSVEFDELNSRLRFLRDIITLSSANTITASTQEALVNATFES